MRTLAVVTLLAAAASAQTPSAPDRSVLVNRRVALDRSRYSQQELAEIERIYQPSISAALPERRQTVQTLLARFPKANRTGCALLRLAASTTGEEQRQLLARSIAEYGDSVCENGLQLGATARVLLARVYSADGQLQKAAGMYAEIERDYPEAGRLYRGPLRNGFPSPAQIAAFWARTAKDQTVFTSEQFASLDRLYQEGNRDFSANPAAARDIFKQVLTRYPKSNRAGCAVLYLAHLTAYEEQEGYLLLAIRDYSDTWYGNGVQVGAMARLMLAQVYQATDRGEKAAKLMQELAQHYPDAIDHGAGPLFPRTH